MANFQRENGGIFQGKITGVTETGRLRVFAKNKEETFDLKEIKFIV
jgi:hypothetical protein